LIVEARRTYGRIKHQLEETDQCQKANNRNGQDASNAGMDSSATPVHKHVYQ
jgi:hypothetical protein